MDTSGFNPTELQHIVEQEKQKAMVNEMLSKITSVCWDKCIAPGTKFSPSGSACFSHCTQRYMDVSKIIMKCLQSTGSMH